MPNRKSKIQVSFEIDVLSIENIPDNFKSDGFIIHWKRSGSSTAKGSSYPILIETPITSFDPIKEHTRFIFNCRFFRDVKNGNFTPNKRFKLAIQLESVLKNKKSSFGKCSIDLNQYAEDETNETIVRPLSKAFSDSIPNVRISIKADWISIDGHALKVQVPSLGTEENISIRTNRKQLSSILRKSVSLFPTGKVSINGKLYELYDQQEEPPDASMSYLSDKNRSDTEIEFTCDEFDSDDEDDNDETFTVKQVPKKEKLTRVESAKMMIKKTTGMQLRSGTSSSSPINVIFTLNIICVSGLPSSIEGKSVFISWRRGTKKKNSGRTKKARYEDGEAIWNDCSDEPITLHCTMTRDPKTYQFEEKNIALSLKKIITTDESNKSVLVGQLLLNLAEYVSDNFDKTKKFKLTERTRRSSKHSSKSETNINEIAKDSSIKQKIKSSSAYIQINITCNYDNSINNKEDEIKKEKKEEIQEEFIQKEEQLQHQTFGICLLDQLIIDGMRVYDIPPVISILIKGIEENGLTRQGIFRLSGRSGQVKEIIDTLNKNPNNLDVSIIGPHELADCLKKYLRALPNSLLPDNYYNECLELGNEYKKAYESKDSKDIIVKLDNKLLKFLQSLPPENTATLRKLSELLYKIQEYQEENKMNIDNLATVFAPTVIQKEIDDPVCFLSDNAKKVPFMKALIYYSPNWIPNEDFSKIDENLKKQQDNLDPTIKIKRLENHLNRSKDQIKELEKQLVDKDNIIIQYELMEFIIRTNQKWNTNRNKYQAAIDIYEHIKQSNAFNPFNSSFLYTVIRVLQILHRRSLCDISLSSFWLAVCLNLLELWETDDNILFIGDSNEKGILPSSDLLNKSKYHSNKLEKWILSIDNIQSCSHFEQQFRHFTLQVFYSLCCSFAEECGDYIISLGLKEVSWSSKSDIINASGGSLLTNAVNLIDIAKQKHIPKIVINQISHCMWREVTSHYLQELGTNKELCTTGAGLKVKMNLTTLLHSIREHKELSSNYSLIEDELQPIQSAANLLVTMTNFSPSIYPSIDSITSVFPLLHLKVIYDILNNYTNESIIDNEEIIKHKNILLSDIELKLK